MASPKLSIIIPVYNSAAYLKKCIDSLLNQTYNNISIICINDGSTDESLSILQAYAAMDSRIRIVSQKNAGQSVARNTGLKIVDSEFVTFLDSDDYLEPNAYEKAMALMEDEVDYVCFGTQVTWDACKNMKRSDEEYFSIKFSGKIQVTSRIVDNTDVSLWNKIFRKSLIDKYEISFPEGLWYEDAYFFKLYGIRSKYAAYTREKLHHYIRRPGSTMSETFSSKSKRSADHLKIAIKFYEYVKQHGLLSEYKRFTGAFIFNMLASAVQYEASEKGKKSIKEQAVRFLESEGLTFAEYPDLHATYLQIKHGDFINRHTEKHLGGLLSIQRDLFRIKYFFCGIPLMRIRMRDGIKKYYLFSIIRIRKKKYTPPPPYQPYTPPLVSVILPVYQAEKSVAYTIRSILTQEYGNLELIIVNDGSTDASADVIRSFKDNRICSINSRYHQGMYESYKQGLALARGKYAIFSRVGDISLCDRLARQVHYLEAHHNVDMLALNNSGSVDNLSKSPNEIDSSSMIRRDKALAFINDNKELSPNPLNVEILGAELMYTK